MADKKITALTDLSTSIASEDLLLVIDDPSGTPINKKVTVKNVMGNLSHATVAADATNHRLISATVTATADQATSGELSAGLFAVNHNSASTSANAIGELYTIKASTVLGDADNNITTSVATIYAELDISASADSVGSAGGYVLSLDVDCSTGARSVAPTAYIALGDKFVTGTNPATYLIDLFPSEARNGTLTLSTPGDYGCYNDASTASTVGGTLKIRVNGEVQYIQTYTATS
jgi:hypothetical protein